MVKHISVCILFAAIAGAGCIKKASDDELNRLLYIADVTHDLNIFQEDRAYENIHEFYLEDSLRGKDKMKDLKFHYGRLLIFKKDTIDSLHKLLAGTFWKNELNKAMDTMTYVNSEGVVSSNAIPGLGLKGKIISYVDILSKVQLRLIEIKNEIERQRPGTKNEKIVCQNCKVFNSSEGIKKANNMAELYFETENQFTIIYRELRCTAFAIKLLDVGKVAKRDYKVRI